MKSELMRIYIETSVFGGNFDDEFMESTQVFFDMLHQRRFIPLISDILIQEITKAPQQVKDLLIETIQIGVERVQINDKSIALRDLYIKMGIIAQRYENDAMHVALATLARADVIASWNFKHLVNPSRIRSFNKINSMQGYSPIVILTPSDLIWILEESNEKES